MLCIVDIFGCAKVLVFWGMMKLTDILGVCRNLLVFCFWRVGAAGWVEVSVAAEPL